MRERAVILGGGVAGLAAAVRLTELGIEPLLIEGAHFPQHKVCGEFFSPECLPQLQSWGIAPEGRLCRIRIHQGQRPIAFDLSTPAGSEARFFFDAKLADLARQKGARLLEGTRVTGVVPPLGEEPWKIELSNGQSHQTDALLLGIGRIGHELQRLPPPTLPFVGYKAHFEGVDLGTTLEIVLLKAGYMGLSSVGEGRINVAILLKQGGDPSDLLQQASATYPQLEQLSSARPLFENWLAVKAPPFGLRPFPKCPGLYPIGDAAAAIPPISGSGLAMGIGSGVLAAEHVAANDPDGYAIAWRQRFRRRLGWAKGLQAALFHPLAKSFLALCSSFSTSLPRYLYNQMRETKGKTA